MKTIKILFLLLVMAPLAAFSQKITVGGQLGWAVPQGKAFEAEEGEKSAKGGLSVDVDVLYHFEQLDGKLAVGLTYNSSFLAGVTSSDNSADIGLYGLALYGVKGQYKFFPGSVSPYVSLSAGLSQFSSPEITVSDVVVQEKTSAYSIGLRPEIGVNLGGFVISAGYYVPVSYKFKDVSESISAGALQISVGFRFKAYSL